MAKRFGPSSTKELERRVSKDVFAIGSSGAVGGVNASV
jgi:hypothetical protein